MLFNF
jgi:hypothetical protein